MAKDVVPELVKSIDKAFKIHTENDKTLARVTKRIRDGTATQEDGHLYALRIGKDSSRALQDVLTADNLPDGTLYYNIATRTVIPTLEANQALVNDAAAEIQKLQDQKAQISLNAIKPKFPQERIDGLIEKMTADDIALEQALAWLREPIVNNSEAFYDDFIRENAEFRSGAGLKTKITRIAEANCCAWCANLEGSWDYGNEPSEVYARHEFCRCSVTYQSEKTSQNVWSKKSWQSTPEELSRREETMPKIKSKYERAEVLQRLEKDQLVRKIMDTTGYTRETAQDLAGQSSDKIEKAITAARRARRR